MNTLLLGRSASAIGMLFLTTAVWGQSTNTFPASGNVGIGTSSPAAKLDIQAAVNGGHIVFTSEGGNSYNTVNSFKADGSTLLGLVARASNYSFYGNDGKSIMFAGDGMYCRWVQAAGTNSLALGGGYGQHMIITPSGNVGIGTVSPASPLSVTRGGGATGTYLASFEGGDTWHNGLLLSNATTRAFSVFVTGSANPTSPGSLVFWDHAAGAARLDLAPSGNVGIGTTNPTNKLEVNGTIRAKEVIVETTGWSDYVFAPDYRLAPLAEVKAHIATAGTLPGIPSATEVAERGVSVGDMQARLLAKVEEMTLHLIALSEKVDAQSTQLSAQSTRITQLEAENAALKRSQP